MGQKNGQFVGRAGEKLSAALEGFSLNVSGFICADFGCNVGGFTDCLLQHGAAKVYAIDTGYGKLAWKLRMDPRVVVMERTNALHASPVEAVDLVTVDVAWTPQRLIVPAAMKWLRGDTDGREQGRVVSLLKPHYELAKLQRKRPHRPIDEKHAGAVCLQVCRDLLQNTCLVHSMMKSPLLGKGGNVEFLLMLTSLSQSISFARTLAERPTSI
ncbi:MAG: hypothetical protein J7M14_01945 [Planctomycetes bacterium]|nr:hypothetical protein [Planctomycetota bacterium]